MDTRAWLNKFLRDQPIEFQRPGQDLPSRPVLRNCSDNDLPLPSWMVRGRATSQRRDAGHTLKRAIIWIHRLQLCLNRLAWYNLGANGTSGFVATLSGASAALSEWIGIDLACHGHAKTFKCFRLSNMFAIVCHLRVSFCPFFAKSKTSAAAAGSGAGLGWAGNFAYSVWQRRCKILKDAPRRSGWDFKRQNTWMYRHMYIYIYRNATVHLSISLLVTKRTNAPPCSCAASSPSRSDWETPDGKQRQHTTPQQWNSSGHNMNGNPNLQLPAAGPRCKLVV